MKGRTLGGNGIRDRCGGDSKTFLRRKVESPTPNTIHYYLTTPIKEYSAEASIYRKFPANYWHSRLIELNSVLTKRSSNFSVLGKRCLTRIRLNIHW